MIRERVKEISDLEDKFLERRETLLKFIQSTFEEKTGLTFEENEYADYIEEGELNLVANTPEDDRVYVRFSYDLYAFEVEDQTDERKYEELIEQSVRELLGTN